MAQQALFPPIEEAVAEPLAPLPERRAVDLNSLPCKTALNGQKGPTRDWFDWSANPYRGCEFGCGYCYARYSHGWLGHSDPRSFQEIVYVKRGFREALRRDLARRVRPGDHIAFGSATDPYQPIERRERVMRSALLEFLNVRDVRVSITTKSALVTRDLDLLTRIAKHNTVQVNFSLTTPDRRLARILESRAPAPAVRIGALKRVREAGIHAGIFLMPLLPGMTDAPADLTRLFRQARDAGAEFIAPQVLFLREPSRSYFLRDLRTHYPRVAARYEVWTRTNGSVPERVRARLMARIAELSDRFGVPMKASRAQTAPPAVVQATFGFC